MLEVQPLISIPCGASVQGQLLGFSAKTSDITQDHGHDEASFSRVRKQIELGL